MSDTVDVKRLRELLAKAVSVPWLEGDSRHGRACIYVEGGGVLAADVFDADAALIVAAVNALPSLLAALEAQTARADAAELATAMEHAHRIAAEARVAKLEARLRASAEAEAEAMAVVMSQEGQIARLVGSPPASRLTIDVAKLTGASGGAALGAGFAPAPPPDVCHQLANGVDESACGVPWLTCRVSARPADVTCAACRAREGK